MGKKYKVYELGLQAGKNVAKVIDEFIQSNAKYYSAVKRKDLSDGTVLYRWVKNWSPRMYAADAELLRLLRTFDNECDIVDDAWKLVGAGSSGGLVLEGNEEGFNQFVSLHYDPCLVFPEGFFEDKARVAEEDAVQEVERKMRD